MTDEFKRRFFLRQTAALVTAPALLPFGLAASRHSELASARDSTPQGLGDFAQSGAGAVSRTGVNKLAERVSAADFGATGDGIANDFDAIAAARDFVCKAPHSRKLIIPSGNYFIGSNELVFNTHGFTMECEGLVEIHGSGDYVVSFASTGGTGQGTNHPASMYVIGLNVRTISPYGTSSNRAAMRVSASYSTFVNCGVTTSPDVGGNGVLLEADDSGSGPFYNTFIGLKAHGAVGHQPTGRGIFMGQRPSTRFKTRYPNTNTFVGGRAAGYLVNWEIAGAGNRYLGPTSENSAKYGTAFSWLAPIPNSNTANTVIAPYIENASVAFSVDTLANAAMVSGGSYCTGVATLVSDPGNRLSIIGGGDGLREIRLAAAPSNAAPVSGIHVGNAANPDPKTFDWYEEATFTPIMQGSISAGTGTTHTMQMGHATRIGNRVSVSGAIGWSGTTETGNLVINMAGIPFLQNPAKNSAVPFLLRASSLAWTTGKQLVGIGEPGSRRLHVEQMDPAGGPIVPVPMSAAGSIFFSGEFLSE